MAVLTWIRLDTAIFENPKLLYLQEDKQHKTIVVYLQSMCYSGRHGLAGFVPKAALRIIGANMSDAKRLVAEGLWVDAPGGWQINGWEEYQLSNDEVLRRSEKAKKAAAARWAQRNGRDINALDA